MLRSSLGGCHTADPHHNFQRFPLDMAGCSTLTLTSTVHTDQARPSHPNSGLGGQRCNLPHSHPALFSIPHIYSATTGRKTSPHHHRSLLHQSVYSCSAFSTRQPLHAGQGACATSTHGGAGHRRSIHANSHASQSSQIPGVLLPKSTLLFQGSSPWSQCGTAYIHQGPGLASINTSHTGCQHNSIPGRRSTVALFSNRPPTSCPTDHRLSHYHGVPSQYGKIPTGTSDTSPVVGGPLASTDGSLAGVPGHP